MPPGKKRREVKVCRVIYTFLTLLRGNNAHVASRTCSALQGTKYRSRATMECRLVLGNVCMAGKSPGSNHWHSCVEEILKNSSSSTFELSRPEILSFWRCGFELTCDVAPQSALAEVPYACGVHSHAHFDAFRDELLYLTRAATSVNQRLPCFIAQPTLVLFSGYIASTPRQFLYSIICTSPRPATHRIGRSISAIKHACHSTTPSIRFRI